MELMSSLLLCTFVAVVPQALGDNLLHTDWDTLYNDSLKNRQRPSTHNKILLNINAPPLVNVVSEVQAVFAEAACQNCMACMERAIKANKINLYMVDNRPSPEELQTDVLSELHNFDSHREKRNLAVNATTKAKKVKSKKNKVIKAVSVTKFNVDEELYALKIKETITQTGDQNDVKSTSTTCQVYNVKNSFPCDTPEGVTLLTAAKIKANKSNKKQNEDEHNKKRKKHSMRTTTQKIVPLFRKRQVDHSQVPENFMPSIEDIY